MTISQASIAAGLAALALSGCGGNDNDGIVTADEAQVFDTIGPQETVHFTGTEPFWGGEVTGSELRYSTPENVDGILIPVERFAGNNGLSFSGQLDGAEFDLAVTPGNCSDGMSDRTYPFVVTLSVRGDLRSGCGWTETMPFTGSVEP